MFDTLDFFLVDILCSCCLPAHFWLNLFICPVSNRLNFLIYADDTTIYFNWEEFEYLNRERDINSELNKSEYLVEIK